MSKLSPLGNLVWIDLEMSGLNANKDVILEIALIITDGQLKVLHEGPHLVIHQDAKALESIDSWPRDVHTKSGLLAAVAKSKTTVAQAEEQVLAVIKHYCKSNTALLAGNSVWQDRIFLAKYMPTIIDYLFYRLIDVTTIKELVVRWYPDNPLREFKKKDTHRALEDIKESIAELAHFRRNFFI